MSQRIAPDQPEQLLELLRDIHLPQAPPWWETHLSAYALTAFVILFVALWIWVKRKRTRPRREALRALAELRSHLGADEDGVAANASTLLRRLAIQRYGRIPVAGLTGERWRSFLDASGGAGSFARVSDALLIAPYQETDDSKVANLLAVTERWIRAGTRPKVLEAIDSRGREARREDAVGLMATMSIEMRVMALWADARAALTSLFKRRRKPDSRVGRTLDGLERACAESDPNAARRALLAWGATVWPEHPPAGLRALRARVGNPDAIAEIHRLEQSLYGDPSTASTWTGTALHSNIRALSLVASAREEVEQGGLPPLHPEADAVPKA